MSEPIQSSTLVLKSEGALPRVLVSDPIEPSGLSALQGVAQLDVRTDLSPEQLLAIVGEYDAWMVRSQTKVTAELLAAASRMRIIGRAGVGVDNIDVPAATRQGVVVVNSPAGNTIAAAEHTLAMLFALARHVGPADAATKRGEWKRSKYVGCELFKKTLGVIGLGKIGSHVARVARAAGMRVVGYDPFVTAERAAEMGVTLSDVESVVSQADFLTLHVPKTPETTNLISAEMLRKAKPGLRIVNCSRGGIIDEAALVEAIDAGLVAGAALDVFAKEPLENDALRALGDKVLLTPHLGASTEEAQLNVAIDVAEQIAEVLQGGEARSAVNIPNVRAELVERLRPAMGLVEKLGAVAAQLADGPIEAVTITFAGTLADVESRPLTNALLKGLLTPALAERVNFVNAGLLAKERGIQVSEVRTDDADDYVELVRVTIRTSTRERIVAGTLLNADLPAIVQVDDYAFNLFLKGALLFAPHQDVPGSVGKVGTILGENAINIFGMQLGRRGVSGPALMVLNLDHPAPEVVLNEIRALQGFFDIKMVQV
ncbi:MAG: phosphoglycerate dehydrogenase [Candidatus Sericytochromatia bacterium]|nr:phosphoglycerate dehydrogenase [Candidatus Sericytochromatia bacterium]